MSRSRTAAADKLLMRVHLWVVCVRVRLSVSREQHTMQAGMRLRGLALSLSFSVPLSECLSVSLSLCVVQPEHRLCACSADSRHQACHQALHKQHRPVKVLKAGAQCWDQQHSDTPASIQSSRTKDTTTPGRQQLALTTLLTCHPCTANARTHKAYRVTACLSTVIMSHRKI